MRPLLALTALPLLLVACPIYAPEKVSFLSDPRILRGSWTVSLTSTCDNPGSVAVSPDGSRIASAGRFASIWNRSTAQRTPLEAPLKGELAEVGWTAEGDLVGLVRDLSDSSFALQRWDPISLKRRFNSEPRIAFGQIVLSRNSSQLASLDSIRGQLSLYRTDSGALQRQSDLQNFVKGSYFYAGFIADDATRFSMSEILVNEASQRWVTRASVWRTSDGALLQRVTVNLNEPRNEYPARGFAYASDGRSALVFTASQTVRLNLETGESRFSGSLGNAYAGFSLSPGGAKLAVSEPDRVRIFDSATLQLLTTKPLAAGSAVGAVRWLPDETGLILPWSQSETFERQPTPVLATTRCGALGLSLNDAPATIFEDDTRESLTGRLELTAVYDSTNSYSISGTAMIGSLEYSLSGTVPMPYGQELQPLTSPLPQFPVAISLKNANQQTIWQTAERGPLLFLPPRAVTQPVQTLGSFERLEDGRVFALVLKRAAALQR